jgi:uncharacterized protein YbaR (Trm112 family)
MRSDKQQGSRVLLRQPFLPRARAHIYTHAYTHVWARVLASRFDPAAMELVNDDIGVAYPIIGGIPRLVPSDGRVLGDAAGADGAAGGAAAVGGGGDGGSSGTDAARR